MVDLLQEILRTGYSTNRAGLRVPVDGAISRLEGEMLQALIRAIRPRTSVEVGLAHGVSALFICEALREVGAERHIVIDPSQLSDYEGIGLENLDGAGFGPLVDFRERPSHHALVDLEREERAVEFAFVDGWTTLDYKLMDALLVDRVLSVADILVVRPGGMPAGLRVVDYIAANWAYEVEAVFPERARGDDRMLVAFRKVGSDTRGWRDHVESWVTGPGSSGADSPGVPQRG